MFSKKAQSKALTAASMIALLMKEEGYDWKSMHELLARLERALFPEDFKAAK